MKKNKHFGILKLSLAFFALASMVLVSCKNEVKQSKSKRNYELVQGKCMGTTYTVKYFDPKTRDFSSSIDSILFVLDKKTLSTYSNTSTISLFNKQKALLLSNNDALDIHFLENFRKAKQVYKKSLGAFDPTVMPLVNYWGFGFAERLRENKDSARVKDLLQYVGMDLLQDSTVGEKLYLEAKSDSLMLDFSALAKGYSVEVLANFLKKKGIQDYYIEVGGELALGGNSPSNQPWVIGVNKPTLDSKISEIFKTLQLTDCFIASSGNYRNYYKFDGRIISHTINPKTGFPEQNNILSTTVISNNGALSDAWATAGMVMGWQRFLNISETEPNIEAFLIYSDENGELRDTCTSGARDFLLP